jgi:hypothetical protein
MGSVAVKTYPGEEWKLGPNRVTFEPDYRRLGKLWVHGAFEHAIGQATLRLIPEIDNASNIQLIKKVIREFPADRWLLIEDNLRIHVSREVKLVLAGIMEMSRVCRRSFADSSPEHRCCVDQSCRGDWLE